MKIMKLFKRFCKTGRSAIAITMAIMLVPLVLLIGIAVDVTFLSQDRLQTAFAAQAAAATATRVAAATYAQEVAVNGPPPTNESAQTAAQQAINSANIVGDLWFKANLGSYSIGSLNSDAVSTTYDGATTGSVNSAAPPNFAAQVTANSNYPPIFNPIFGHSASQPWVYSSGGTATTQFSYAQILFMLDTSNSMLIGARQSDIQTMEENSVCPESSPVATVVPDVFDQTGLSYQKGQSADYSFAPGDNTWIGFSPSDALHVAHYNTNSTATGIEPPPTTLPSAVGGQSPFQMNGPCDSGYRISGAPFEPCALACHSETSTFTLNGQKYYQDLYGLARSEGVELRVDVLLSATENAIQDMESSEAVAGQLSAGVYQFNVDVQPIVRGNTGSGDALPEATSNLSSALTAVQNVDYNYNKSETSIPVLVSDPNCATYVFPTQESCGGNTDLVQSMAHLVAGKLPTDSGAQPLTAAGNGNTAAKPLKFLFLVTDGMEGEYLNGGAADLNTNPAYNHKGVMTSLVDNQAVTNSALTPGTCTGIKKLGYIVYVLYVDYLPVSENQYYLQTGALSAQTLADFPKAKYLVDVADPMPDINKGGTPAQITANIENDVPTAEALAQCASSTSDFYAANSDTEIQNALNAMLKSALASTIRLTN